MQRKNKGGANWLLVTIGLLAILAGVYLVWKFVLPSPYASVTSASLKAITPDQDAKGQGYDSQCPPGAPTINFHGTPQVGTRDWFDALPKETTQGIWICVNTAEYRGFLLATGTNKGGVLDGKRVSGWDELAYHYSYASVGNASRLEPLKQALIDVKYAQINGVPVKDTIWIKLPGYKTSPALTAIPLCASGACYLPNMIVPLKTKAAPQPTAMFTPTPPYADTPVPTIQIFTPVPQTAPLQITADEWLKMFKGVEVYEGQHCAKIGTLDFRTLATSNVWLTTTQLTFKLAAYGWTVQGDRNDVYVPGYGEYPVLSFCGQVSNMPSPNNVDGKGTIWNPGIVRFYPLGQIDPKTGMISAGNGWFWINVNGIWLAPARPALSPIPPTVTPWPSPTPQPPSNVLTVDQAIVYKTSSFFLSWTAVDPNALPTAANPKIWMNSYQVTFLIDFTKYLGNIGGGHSVMLDNCGTPVMAQFHGYKLATNQQLNVSWCLLPGK